MGTFHSIDELIRTLDREKILLKEMFAKRHSLQFRYDYAGNDRIQGGATSDI